MSTGIDTPVLTVTDDALETILGLRAAEEDGDTLALRVEITGSRGADYTYDLAFEALAEAAEDDAVYQQGDLSVWIPAESVEHLMGATLDLPGVPGQGGLVLRNPNRPDPSGPAPSSAATSSSPATRRRRSVSSSTSRSTRRWPATAASPR